MQEKQELEKKRKRSEVKTEPLTYRAGASSAADAGRGGARAGAARGAARASRPKTAGVLEQGPWGCFPRSRRIRRV